MHQNWRENQSQNAIAQYPKLITKYYSDSKSGRPNQKSCLEPRDIVD